MNTVDLAEYAKMKANGFQYMLTVLIDNSDQSVKRLGAVALARAVNDQVFYPVFTIPNASGEQFVLGWGKTDEVNFSSNAWVAVDL